jgi:hypothetical protein
MNANSLHHSATFIHSLLPLLSSLITPTYKCLLPCKGLCIPNTPHCNSPSKSWQDVGHIHQTGKSESMMAQRCKMSTSWLNPHIPILQYLSCCKGKHFWQDESNAAFGWVLHYSLVDETAPAPSDLPAITAPSPPEQQVPGSPALNLARVTHTWMTQPGIQDELARVWWGVGMLEEHKGNSSRAVSTVS